MKRILVIILISGIVAGAAVAQPETPGGTSAGTATPAPTAANSTDFAPTAVSATTTTAPISSTPRSTPRSSRTPSGTAMPATATAVSTDSASTAVSTDEPQGSTPANGTPAATQTPVPGTNFTGPDGGPGDYELVIDRSVAITEWRYQDGTFIIDFYAEDYTSLTMVASPSGSSDQGAVEYRGAVLDGGSITTVRIGSDSKVSMWTEASAENGRAVYLDKPSTAFVSGPYDGTDVRNAAIGAALGVALAVLYEAVAAKLGSADGMERVA